MVTLSLDSVIIDSFSPLQPLASPQSLRRKSLAMPPPPANILFCSTEPCSALYLKTAPLSLQNSRTDRDMVFALTETVAVGSSLCWKTIQPVRFDDVYIAKIYDHLTALRSNTYTLFCDCPLFVLHTLRKTALRLFF